MLISVIVPTYNPLQENLKRTLEGLRKQRLPIDRWELIIIDNNSSNNFSKTVNLDWHPNSKIIIEPKQGLTYARIKGFKNAKGAIIIMVDDDNILDENYLENVNSFFENHHRVGTVGGKSLALFDGYIPEKWSLQFLSMVAVRDLGDETIFSKETFNDYPPYSPIGAGMAIRAKLLNKYIDYIEKGGNQTTDRIGNSLASGGDNEINIFVLKQGYCTAYHPKLILQHIIPSTRLTKSYLARLNYESTVSWIKLLAKYDIKPWQPISKFTLPLRKLKAFFIFQPWQSKTRYINWKGACGLLKAQSEIS